MRKDQKRYEEIFSLPPTALTVRRYADTRFLTTSHVYKLYKQGFLKIVVYQKVNWVLTDSDTNKHINNEQKATT